MKPTWITTTQRRFRVRETPEEVRKLLEVACARRYSFVELNVLTPTGEYTLTVNTNYIIEVH